MTKSFDSLSFATALIEGGFPEPQAKALAAAMWALIDSQLATKADLAALELRFMSKIQEVRTEMLTMEERFDRKLEKLKAELIQWMCGALILQSGVTAVLFKLLH